jgi:hypothetical protein
MDKVTGNLGTTFNPLYFKSLKNQKKCTMGKITLRIDDATEQRFREVAKNIFGGKRGYLRRAATEAVALWIQDKMQEVIAQQGLALVEKEHHLGKLGYHSREDIYDRKSCLADIATECLPDPA